MVETDKAPFGNPPLSESVRISHLKDFKAPDETGEAEAAAEELADELKDFKLPKTLKAAHDLLLSVQAENPVGPDEVKTKEAKIAALAAHISKLGQGHQPIIIGMDQRKEICDAQSENAANLKLEALARTHPEMRVLLEKLANLEKQVLTLTKK